jgi:hypothetical protein
VVVAATTVVLALASGCGGAKGDSAKEHDKGFEKAADGKTCVADAKRVGKLPTGFPADFPFPRGSVVYNAEDRGKDGVIVSAITKSTIKAVLADLNGPAQDAGFKVTNGETEKHDAEANWSGNGFRGRWAIKESANCAGEISIQVLAAKG